jgi:hypothetical protein
VKIELKKICGGENKKHRITLNVSLLTVTVQNDPFDFGHLSNWFVFG